MKRIDFRILMKLFVVFFKAGTFTFAGGLAMLPVIEKDVVEKYALMGKDEFLEYATLAQTLPGTIALNCSSFVGLRAAGFLGMLVAGFGATVSAFVIMLAATIAMRFIPDTGPVMGAMSCIRAAAAALILSAAFTLGAYNLKSRFAVIIMLAAFFLVCFLKLSAPIVIILAGLAGYCFERFKMRRKGEEQ